LVLFSKYLRLTRTYILLNSLITRKDESFSLSLALRTLTKPSLSRIFLAHNTQTKIPLIPSSSQLVWSSFFCFSSSVNLAHVHHFFQQQVDSCHRDRPLLWPRKPMLMRAGGKHKPSLTLRLRLICKEEKFVVRNRSMYFLIQNHDDGDKKYTADEFYRRTLKHDWRNKKLLQSSSTSESPPSVVPLLRINIQNEQ
jgi:hypothetical protein